MVTGRPVPRAVVEADRDTARERLGVPPDAPCVLVFGGSLGARSAEPRGGRGARATRMPSCCTSPAAATSPRCAARLGDAQPDYRLLEYLDSLADPLAAARPGRGPRRRLGLRDRGGGQARDPGPLSARHRRPPDRQRALDGGRRRGGGAARRRADRRAPARRGEELLGDPSALEQMAAASQSLARPDAAAADRRRGAGGDRGRRGARRATAAAASGPGAGGACTSSGIGGAGMSGLALIAQRARRRGHRLRPRRDAVLRGAARGGHRAARSATTPRTSRPGTELVVSTAIPADLPEVAARASRRVLHRGGAARSRPRAAARDRGRRHARQDDDDRDGRARAGRVRARARVRDRRGAAAPGGANAAAGARGSGWSSRPTSPTARSCASIPRSPCVTNVELDHHTTYRVRAGGAGGVRIASSSACRRTAPPWCGREQPCAPPAGRTGVAVRARPRCRRCGAGHRADRHRAAASSWSVTDEAVGDRRAAGAGRAQRPERARGARRLRGRGLRLEQAAAALASFRPPGRRFEPRGEARRRARVRRLRPPPDRGGGDAARRPARSSRGGWSPSSSRISTRARCTRTASSAARWRSRTWSWCSTSTAARERPEGELAGVSGKLVADAAADQRRRAPGLVAARRSTRRSASLAGLVERGRPGRDARRGRRRRRSPAACSSGSASRHDQRRRAAARASSATIRSRG